LLFNANSVIFQKKTEEKVKKTEIKTIKQKQTKQKTNNKSKVTHWTKAEVQRPDTHLVLRA